MIKFANFVGIIPPIVAWHLASLSKRHIYSVLRSRSNIFTHGIVGCVILRKDIFMFYKDERLALFIDGSNLYAAAKALGFDIDYKLLRKEFMRRGKLLRAFYYTALLENDEYSPIRPLVDWLNYNGFTMVTKPAKEYTDSMGRRKVKGNMDIELAVNAMELAPHVDHIVLFSGDGDFRPLIESIQRQGVRVSVVSTIRSQPPMISDELRRQADNFIELNELKDVLGRPAREFTPETGETVTVEN
jgi:uncharacterized LabA/DUF88 family protein